jgi:hypothetical protein
MDASTAQRNMRQSNLSHSKQEVSRPINSTRKTSTEWTEDDHDIQHSSHSHNPQDANSDFTVNPMREDQSESVTHTNNANTRLGHMHAITPKNPTRAKRFLISKYSIRSLQRCQPRNTFTACKRKSDNQTTLEHDISCGKPYNESMSPGKTSFTVRRPVNQERRL